MELYHVLNRGVDGRKLFLDSQDYARFVHNLYEFNDTAPAANTNRRAVSIVSSMFDLRGRTLSGYTRKKLVKIHGWCLMRNHYHLILSELIEGGLAKFMMKVNVGYAKYYNERYKRQGHLFQGKTKKIHIEREAQFLYILHYVHLNPLDYLTGAEKWRERDKDTIKNTRYALKYLNEYRWSSYLDYCGVKNFPSILSKDPFTDFIGNYRDVIKDYLKDVEGSSATGTLE